MASLEEIATTTVTMSAEAAAAALKAILDALAGK